MTESLRVFFCPVHVFGVVTVLEQMVHFEPFVSRLNIKYKSGKKMLIYCSISLVTLSRRILP